MIPLSLRGIASVVGGTVTGEAGATVSKPAVLDGRWAEPGALFVALAGGHVDGHATTGSLNNQRPAACRLP